MAHEDISHPSTAVGGYARQAALPVDQSKSFLGGQHHPWRRFFARSVDVSTSGLLLFMLVYVLFCIALPEWSAGIAKAVENPLLASIVLHLIWMPGEALWIALFGMTPAKWLFGIRVQHPTGDLLSFPQALGRSLRVFFQGVGLGVPLFAFFAQLLAYQRLTKTGATRWDHAIGAVVLHKDWGVFRTLACTAVVVGVLVLLLALHQWSN